MVLTQKEIYKRYYEKLKKDPVRWAKKLRVEREWTKGHPLTEEQRGRRREAKRRFYKVHREQILEESRLYHRRKKGTHNLIRTGVCSRCGEKKDTDGVHLIPRWLSHDDSTDNVKEMCKSCHRSIDHTMLNFLAGRYNDEDS